MICQECNERPAALHFKKFVNGEQTTIHLCERCAKEKSELLMMDKGAGFSINDLLAGLFNFDAAVQTAKLQSQSPSPYIVQCDVCKLTYKQFIETGKFGCAHCYTAFKDYMDPILKRLHSGNTHHAGKVPARLGGSLHLKREIQQLKDELTRLIVQEEFEQAAEVRDRIRSLEKNISEGGK